MTSTPPDTGRRVPAIVVHQWLPEWRDVPFESHRFRKAPPKHFYLFTLSAAELKVLSGIFRRSTKGGVARARDLGIQRRHDEERSIEIRDFVKYGFPWSSLSQQRRDSGSYDDLKMPGWLPTAIVVNILRPEESREGRSVHQKDVIEVRDTKGKLAELVLPDDFRDASWRPKSLAPLEIIDGQHRLWAFEGGADVRNFELPVVAFYGLDISWQAYLFYTINIKPKRINTSLAFDLYPLLRTEDWLERFEGHSIYRETRAQEITEALWSYPKSPWYERIDMLGERGRRNVTQAAWIRSLLATFVKAYEGKGVKIGGLFGAPVGADALALGWTRAQQSAFVICLWDTLKRAVADVGSPWAHKLRQEDGEGPTDPAFAGRFTLLNSDQGVRGVLAIFNDLCYLAADDRHLSRWQDDTVSEGTAEGPISQALQSLKKQPVYDLLIEIADSLSTYDWRTSASPGLSDRDKSSKARFRGGTGYRELRADLLHHVAASGGTPGELAADAADWLGL